MSTATKVPFTEKIDNFIVECMVERRYETLYSNPFAEIEKEIPKYKPKRIRQRWVDNLKPGLNREPLSVDEKKFIVQWIENNLGPNDEINWKNLICDMEVRFNTLRPDTIPKNYWYSLKRCLLSKMFHNEDLNRLQILSLLAE